MKDDTKPPQTFAGSLLAFLGVLVFCSPVIVTVCCITAIVMSAGVSLWVSLAISVVVTALLMAYSISQQGNSLMEVMIAMFIIMVLAIVMVPVFHKAKENREKRELQMKRQRTPASAPIPDNTR
ncbi:MAG: hypothetical protein EOP04_29735 [Proteobacteria bacterium]|nr:MAG: hypothetical protein EOP04_29735 [Pseudomonadota bacterium]